MTTTTNPGNYVDFDEYVGLKLEKTRSTIRTTDLLTALAGVAAMFLGYLLIFVILDQWVVRDGFGLVWRWILLSTLMISTVAWLVWKIGIPSFRTVNGLFAAREIEKAEPGLKSSLLNLIDLKAAGRSVNPAILKALERRAAVRLQEVDVSQAIDHRPLVRTAYVLLAVIVLFCLYALLSPKKISNSIWRGLLPAANVPIATRTEILAVRPGDVTIPAHTPSVEIQVDLAGEIPHQVSMLYTTADGRFNRQPVELRVEAEGQTRFKGQLVAENSQGLMQDVFYVIKAGDAESTQYKITVEQPPSADVETLRIEFPSYMKLEPVIQSQNGQIDAWEGAKVTVTAKTNMAVRSGTVQFLDDPQVGPTGEDIPMSVTAAGRQLQTSWNLVFRTDGSFAKYYRIDCRTEDDRRDTAPTNHSVTIRPDLPPEVAILQPERDIEAAANATIPLLIQASDPDFELGYVYINADMGGQRVHREILSEGHQQKALIKYDLALSKFKPKAGDTIEVWAEAYDNKQPRPNTRNSPKITIRVLDPVSRKEADQQLADESQRREEKLAEAERDMNSDARENVAQPDSDHQRDKPENSRSTDDAQQAASRNQEPKESEQSDGSGSDSGTAQQKKSAAGSSDQNPSGTSESSRSNPKAQSRDDQGKDEGAESTGERSSDSKQNRPISSNGSEDDEAIRRLNETLNRGNRKNETPRQERDQDSTKNESEPSPESGRRQPEKSQEKNKGTDSATGAENPKPSAEEGNERKQDSTKPSSDDGPDGQNQDSVEPPPKATPPKTKAQDPADESTPAADKTMKEKTSSGNDAEDPVTGENDQQPGGKKKERNPKGTDKPSPDEKSDPDDASSKDPKAEKPQADGQENEGDVGKDPARNEKSNPGKAQNDKNSRMKPGQEQGGENDTTGSSKSPAKDDGKNESSKTPSTDDSQNGGKKKPASKPDPANPKPGSDDSDDTPDGPAEPAAETPNAKKKEADGTEKGVAKPDRDPTSKPKSVKNDNVTRDPNEAPETRPGDSTGKDEPKPSGDKKPGRDPKSRDSQGRNPDPSQNPQSRSEEMKDDAQESSQPGAKSKPDGKKPGSDGDANNDSSENGSDPAKPDSTTSKSQSTSKEKTGKPSDSPSSDPGSQSKTDNSSGDKPEKSSNKDQNSRDRSDGDSDENSKEGAESDASGDQSSTDKKQEGAQKQSDSSQGKKGSGDKESGAKKDGEKGKGEKGGEKQSGSNKGAEKGSDEAGGQSGGKSDPGKSASSSKSSPKPGPAEGGGSSGGGEVGEGDGSATEGGDAPEVAPGEDANLEYNKQATELILQKLKKELERGEVDPELLEQLGWTQDEMKQFADRLSKYLEQSKRAEETPEAKARQQQFQEMLKNLDLQKSGAQRSGEKEPKRDVLQIDSKRAPVPPAYRSAYDKFTRDMARQKPAPAKKN